MLSDQRGAFTGFRQETALLALEELHEPWNDLPRRLVDESVSRPKHEHALDIGCNHFALRDEEIATRFFAA